MAIQPFNSINGFSTGNANVVIDSGSNFTGATVSASGTITAQNFVGDGATLATITGANVTGYVPLASDANVATVAGTVTTNAQPNITSVGTLSSLTVTGNTVINGNLTVDGDIIYTNVQSFNVEDPVIGIGRGANNTPLTDDDDMDRGEQMWYYDGSERSAFIGYQNSSGKLIGATDVTLANNVVSVNGYGNILLGGIEAASISTSGDVIGLYLIGDGSNLSSLTGANVSGSVADAIHASVADVASEALSVDGANVSGQVANAVVAGTVYVNAQPNITSVGTLTSLVVSGNVSANVFVGNAAGLTNIPAANISGNVTANNANTSNYVMAGGAQNGNFYLTLQSSTSGYAQNLGNTAFVANATTGTLYLSTSVASGNVTGGNIRTAGQVSATGNVTGGYFIGNGSTLSSITGPNVTGYVATATAANTAGTVTTAAQPNITSVGTLSSLSVTGATTVGSLVGGSNSNSNIQFGATNVTISANGSSNIATFSTVGSGAANITFADPDGVIFNVTNTGTGKSFVINPAQGLNATGGADLPLQSGNSKVSILSNANVAITVAGTSNVVVAATSGVYVSGLTSVSGNVTGGNLITSGGASVQNWIYVPQLWFVGRLSTDLSLTGNVDNTINWSNTADPNSWYSSGNQRVTPGRTGWYQVDYKVNFTASGVSGTGQLNTQILVNGTQVGFAQATNNQNNGLTVMNSQMLYLSNTTDYFTFTAYTTTNGQGLQSGTIGTQVSVRWIST